jgi:hypothetical protein
MSKSNPSHTIQFRVLANRQPCVVPRCLDTRHGASVHCQKHQRAVRQHGHPLGRKIHQRDYAPERKEAERTLREFSHHPGLAIALAFIGDWIERAERRARDVPGGAQLARLSGRGVTALEIVTECAAVWSLAEKHPGLLPDDERLNFALANAVFHLAPRDHKRRVLYGGRVEFSYTRIPKADRRSAGAFIREHLSQFLHNVANAPKQAAVAAEAARQALLAPFTPVHAGRNLLISTAKVQ